MRREERGDEERGEMWRRVVTGHSTLKIIAARNPFTQHLSAIVLSAPHILTHRMSGKCQAYQPADTLLVSAEK